MINTMVQNFKRNIMYIQMTILRHRHFNIGLLLCVISLGFSCNSTNINTQSNSITVSSKPNVVIIFLDDAGYADYSPFAQQGVQTPHVETLAKEGTVFTNFHVPQAICSASRSALISGCYPGRTKVFGAHGPKGRGLEPTFPTIGEVFSAAGYKTALFGKWHCGDQPDTRPQARGFNETCGLMYSNDMWKHHPVDPEYWGKYPIQFWENGKVTIEDVGIPEQKMLTKWYTEHAVDFINHHKDGPFLLYVPHSMPHVPIFCSKEFEGKSGVGLYGDVTMELDWSVGEITKALKDNGLEENTIVIFSSDNGPWSAYGNHAGKTPFREAKATSFDGGIRSPLIIKYPNMVKAGKRSDNAFFSIDLLPTLCHLAGVPVPETAIDGENVWDLISGNMKDSLPHEYYAISTGNRLESIMSGDGKWKLHLPHTYRVVKTPGKDGSSGEYSEDTIELSLFDMKNDPFETNNVMKVYPDIAEKLKRYAQFHMSKFYTNE
jgi:arylsulfatase A